jgi:hypothetical protein
MLLIRSEKINQPVAEYPSDPSRALQSNYTVPVVQIMTPGAWEFHDFKHVSDALRSARARSSVGQISEQLSSAIVKWAFHGILFMFQVQNLTSL